MKCISEEDALQLIEFLNADYQFRLAELVDSVLLEHKEPLRPMSDAPKIGSILVKFKSKNTMCEAKINGDFIRVIGGARALDDAEGWMPMPEVDHD
jgi:hypothetical protein